MAQSNPPITFYDKLPPELWKHIAGFNGGLDMWKLALAINGNERRSKQWLPHCRNPTVLPWSRAKTLKNELELGLCECAEAFYLVVLRAAEYGKASRLELSGGIFHYDTAQLGPHAATITHIMLDMMRTNIDLGTAHNIDFIPDFTPYAKLQSLEISWSLTPTIDFLATSPGLTEFEMGGSLVGSLAPLSNCPNLTKLTITNNELTSLDGVQQCSRLMKLAVFFTQIASIAEVSSLRHLNELDIHATNVKDLSPVRHCLHLQTLKADDTFVADCGVLSELPNLRFLDLRHTRVKRFEALCPRLENVNLAETPVSVISGLSCCRYLRVLNLSRTNVNKLCALKPCKNLESLDISHTPIIDLRPIKSCVKLKSIDAYGTMVKGYPVNKDTVICWGRIM